MKFLCQNCNAKYQIADEKISGRTLRMKCRRCEHEIVLHGETSAAGDLNGNPQSSLPPAGTGGSQRAPRPAAPHAAQKKPGTRQGSGVGPAPQRPVPAPKKTSALGADFKRQIGQGPTEGFSAASAQHDQWHVAINEVPVGPIRRDELLAKISAGAVSGESLCWREGFDDWRPMSEVPELASLLRKATGAGSIPPPRGAAGRQSMPRTSSAQPPRGLPRRPPAPPKQTRSNVVLIGGRLGVAALEEQEEFDAEPTRIAPFPHEPMPAAMQVSYAQTSPGAYVAPPVPPSRRMSPAVLAMVVGAGAFGVAVALVLGTRLLGPNTVVVQAAPTQTAAEHAPLPIDPDTVEARPRVQEVAAEPEEMIEQEVNMPQRRVGTKIVTATPTKQAATNPQDDEFLRRFGEGLDRQVGVDVGDSQEQTGPRRQPLSDQQVRSVVTRNQPQLQRCYELAIRGMREAPSVRINIGIAVGESGAVTRASAAGGTLPALNNCIESQVRRWRFPANEGGAEIPPFPVVFQPGG